MIYAASLLVLLPAVVLSGPNTPKGWSCKPLTQMDTSHEDCVQSATYSSGVWSVQTTKVAGSAGGFNRFCVVTLTGAGVDVKETEDFYVRATFANSGARGPFGGLSFNMQDTDNGNYVMMRVRTNVQGNVETGKLVNKMKGVSQTTNNQNAEVLAGNPTLEILVKDDKEDVWIGGKLEDEISDVQPYYVKPGAVGFAFQNVAPWNVQISNAEVCTVPCYDDDGKPFLLGESYKDGIKTCTCKAEGFECACGSPDACSGDKTPWVDPETCETKCVPQPAYCSSSGDPHYGSFDGKYYDFHGVCTYQAASCGDFTVNFKNVDLHGRAPRYTGRIELEFQGQVFSIANGWQAKVEGVYPDPVLPYIKNYNNGDRVEIINNGQLEILLYSKGRNPSVRLRATDYGTWINAEMWLHGSCADVTEGMCGNWNGNPNDDLTGGSGNTLGVLHQLYDENCPAPPPPPDPCRDIDGHDEAERICSALINDPFSKCNTAVPVGNRDEGLMKQCMMDSCNCFNDPSCACAQFDDYASMCQNHAIDLSKWREDVDFCPYKCPAPTQYNAEGATPVPTCLDRNPKQTGTVRGCFCPDGQFLQDGECVDPTGCKCLYEGLFYNNGAKFEKDDKCPRQTCTCKDGGEMVCEDHACPVLNCASDELEARKDDECCKHCLADWVVALNPVNQLKKGQKVRLTCDVQVEGVGKRNIVWKLGDKKITSGISKNKLILTIDNADEADDGTYTCEATKDGKTAKAEFEVDVVMPKICEHEDGHKFEVGTTYKPQETEECTCDAQGVHHCTCIDGEKCEEPAEKDLVEAKEDTVEFVEGKVIRLTCTKLLVVRELTWTCNGQNMVNGEGNVNIKNKKGYSQLTLNPAKMSDEGKCTCNAKGRGGAEDSADFTIKGAANEVTITPDATEVTCKQGVKQACAIKFAVKSSLGAIPKRAVKICPFKNGKVGKCKVAKFKKGKYLKGWGKLRKPTQSGDFVAQVIIDGKKFLSEPVSLTIIPRDNANGGGKK